MSFFGETRNFGWVFAIASIITVVCGIVALVSNISDFGIAIVAQIGTIVANILVLIFALGVIRGNYYMNAGRFINDASSPFGVLTGYLSIYGIAEIIMGVTALVSAIIAGAGISVGIVPIVVGVLFLLIVFIMTDGKQTLADKIIFVLLVILFILALLGGVLALIASIAVISEGIAAILGIVVAAMTILEMIFVLAFLFSSDTKKELGV